MVLFWANFKLPTASTFAGFKQGLSHSMLGRYPISRLIVATQIKYNSDECLLFFQTVS
jgi:hypothetical protein